MQHLIKNERSNLAEVPESIGRLGGLVSLDVSQNKLISEFPKIFLALPKTLWPNTQYAVLTG